MKTESVIKARVAQKLTATPEKAFDAWLSKELVGQWMFGQAVRDEDVVRISLSPHVGGSFSFVVNRQGAEIDHVGQYLEILRPQRLAFTWAVKDEGSTPSRVIVDFLPLPTGCEVVLTHELDPAWSEYKGRIEASWKKTLSVLAETVK